MDPEIPIQVYDDEWLTRSFRMRVMKPGVTLPKGIKITEDNLEEYTNPYDLTGKKLIVEIRNAKKSGFTPIIYRSDLVGILVQDFEEGLWRFDLPSARATPPNALTPLINGKEFFYTVRVEEANGMVDRRWSGDFEVKTR